MRLYGPYSGVFRAELCCEPPGLPGAGYGVSASAAQKVLKKDLFDLTAADLAGFDVVIDAFGAWTEDTLPQHSTSLKHLCDALSGTDTRLLIDIVKIS